MYKTKAELLEMTRDEIVYYIAYLEANDPVARENGLEYVEWCGGDLEEAIEELGIDIEDVC